MDNIRILYASWCNEKGHDKVWGYFYVGKDDNSYADSGTPVFVFYGARGKAIQLKQHKMSYELYKLKTSKQNKGYNQVTESAFLDMCPNFYTEVDNKLTFAILAGNTYEAAK